MIIDKIMEMMSLAIRLTNETEDDYFVDYAGHVNWVQCYYYSGGFDAKKDRIDLIDRLDIDTDGAEKKIDDTVELMRLKLEQSKTRHYEVDYRCYASVTVEATSVEEALQKAEDKWHDAFVDDKTGFKMDCGEPYCVVNLSASEDDTGVEWLE